MMSALKQSSVMHTVYYTVQLVFSGVLIFVKSQRKPSELIFIVLNFMTAGSLVL